MSQPTSQSNIISQPVVRVARLGELKVYPVYEAELDRLAIGGPDSVFLTLTTFFFSSFFSLLITLCTVDIKVDRLFYSFLIFCIISGITALVLGLLWWRNRVSSRLLLKEIKQRIPRPTGAQEPG